MQWSEVNYSPDYEVSIQHQGTRELIFSKKKEGSLFQDFTWELIPYFNVRNRIIGTQLIESGQMSDLLIFDNKDDTYPENIPENPLIQAQGYKLYRGKRQGGMHMVMAYSKIRASLIDNPTYQLKNLEISSIVE